MSEQPDPLRLADLCKHFAREIPNLSSAFISKNFLRQLEAELRRLHEHTYWQDRKIDGLRAVADHHNDRIAALEKALTQAVEALEFIGDAAGKEALATARQTLGGKHD